ncbi:MAG: DNA repair protein RecO [Tannerella sp.]|jgi:DNA repair protein RecO (recombination protein O)|nr:DNA repair protein RecO [Tannerella sp.]
MLTKTRAIILHVTPYNDTYSMVHVYTEVYGRATYLVAARRKHKSRVSNAHFMPLSIVEMEVEHKKNRDIQRLKEVRILYPLVNIPSHPVKNTIALFLAETLYRIIHSSEPDAKLFDYLYHSIRHLEILEHGIANFHLVFLIYLTRHLGIFPNAELQTPDSLFDLLNGVFTTQQPAHPHFLNKEESLVFARLLRMNYENMALYTFSRKERNLIVQQIFVYYRLHSVEFPEIKSLAVMQALYD